jgi:cytochrome c oxidase assembly factor CtaG
MPHQLLALSAASGAGRLVPIALAGVLYARRARTLARKRRGVARSRQACFYAGLLTALAAIVGLDHAASVSLYWRVVQLLLIGDVATLLIVLGLSAPLLAPLMRMRAMDRVRVLASPPLAFALWTANLYLWLLSPLYPAALEYAGIETLEQFCFVVFGVNMWICLLGPLPMPRWFGNGSRLLYVLALRIGAVVLANLFLWSGRVFSSQFAHSDIARHVSPLVDQNVAGAIMLVESALATLGLFFWLYRRTLRDGEAPARIFDFDRELIREFSQPRPRRRRTVTPAPVTVAARDGELRRRRFERDRDPARAIPQREVLDPR